MSAGIRPVRLKAVLASQLPAADLRNCAIGAHLEKNNCAPTAQLVFN
jgi:hypothetical protein